MPSYSEYKDSGVEWLVEIPSHWEVVPVKGLYQREKRINHPEKELLSVYRDYGVIPKSSRDDNNNKESDDLTPYQLVKVDDLVMNKMKAWQGSIAVSEYEGIVSPAYYVYSPRTCCSKRAYPRYIHYLLRNPIYITQFMARSKGIRVNQWDLDPGAFERVELLLPSKDEQENIYRFLDCETARIDKLIAEKQNFINLLKEKRQALISHVVTKGLNPKVKMKDSGIEWIGEVPEHWVVRKLKYAARIQSGIPKGKNLADKDTISVPMLRVANVQDGYLDLYDVHQIEIEPNELERYSLKYGDVLMNEGGDNDKLGRGAVWREQISPCIHQNHVFAIRTYGVEPEWLEFLTQSSYAKFHFYYSSKQSTNLASISSTNIKLTPLVIPPAEERKKIMEYLGAELSKSDTLFNEVTTSVELLKEHRTALISAAVTGKIDVRNQV